MLVCLQYCLTKLGASHVEVAEQDGSVGNTNKTAAPVLARAGNAEDPERSDSDESGWSLHSGHQQ